MGNVVSDKAKILRLDVESISNKALFFTERSGVKKIRRGQPGPTRSLILPALGGGGVVTPKPQKCENITCKVIGSLKPTIVTLEKNFEK